MGHSQLVGQVGKAHEAQTDGYVQREQSPDQAGSKHAGLVCTCLGRQAEHGALSS